MERTVHIREAIFHKRPFSKGCFSRAFSPLCPAHRPPGSPAPGPRAREPPSSCRPAGGARPPPAAPRTAARAPPREASSERCRFSWTPLLLWVVVQTWQTVSGFQERRRCSKGPRPGRTASSGIPRAPAEAPRRSLSPSPRRADHARVAEAGRDQGPRSAPPSRRPRRKGRGGGGRAATGPRASRHRPAQGGPWCGAPGGLTTGGQTSGDRSARRPAAG